MLNDFSQTQQKPKAYDRATLQTILHALVDRLTDDAIDNLHGAGTLDELIAAANAPKNFGEDSRERHCEACDAWEDDHKFGCPVAALATWINGDTVER